MPPLTPFAAILVALAIPVAVATPVQESPVSPDAVVSQRDIVYARPATGPLHLDLHRPRTAPGVRAPVLVVIHGGGWSRGERPGSWTSYRRFVDAGFAVVSLQYRLSGQARAPAAVADVRCAMGWIAGAAAREGLDADRIVLRGTSAGAHLALMAGMIDAGDGLDAPGCGPVPRAAAILDFYGPTDLRREATGAWHSPSIDLWVGEGADGAAMAARMSPLPRVRPGLPPVFIAHGDADPVVPLQSSTLLKAALDRADVPAELHVVPGGGHGKFGTEAQDRLMTEAVAFLKAGRVIR